MNAVGPIACKPPGLNPRAYQVKTWFQAWKKRLVSTGEAVRKVKNLVSSLFFKRVVWWRYGAGYSEQQALLQESRRQKLMQMEGEMEFNNALIEEREVGPRLCTS